MVVRSKNIHRKIVNDFVKTATEDQVVWDALKLMWENRNSGTAFSDNVGAVVKEMTQRFDDRFKRLCELAPHEIDPEERRIFAWDMSEQQIFVRTSSVLRVAMVEAAQVIGSTSLAPKPTRILPKRE